MKPMKQSTDRPVFRELDGLEAKVIVINDILNPALKLVGEDAPLVELRKLVADVLDGTHRFELHCPFPTVGYLGEFQVQYSLEPPVLKLKGYLKVKVMLGESHPKPFMATLDVSTGHLGEIVIDEKYTVERQIGLTTETAPDKVREEHGLVVKQPQKDESGHVKNMPVER